MRYPLIAAIMSCLMLACTSQVVEFPTPLPTATPFALPSPLPTATPAPTATPVSVEFPTPLPTATPFALPSPVPTTVHGPSTHATAFQDLDEVARNGVALISPYGFPNLGTAWLVRTDRDDGYMMLSARHVICAKDKRSCANTVKIEWPGSWPSGPGGVAMGVVDHSEELDLVLLKSRVGDLSQWLHKWELGDAPQLGDEVRHIATRDYRGLKPVADYVPFVSAGVVGWVGGEVLYTTASSIPGESGGLVVDSDMRAVGMITRGILIAAPANEGDVKTAFNTESIHINAIREFLIKAGYLNP